MTELNNNQDKLGARLVVTEAELTDLQHPINKHGDTRQGGTGLGKHAGMKVLVDLGANTTELTGDALSFNLYKEVMALGSKSSDPYMDMTDATAMYVPVNIEDPDNTDTTWTLDNNATYADGYLEGADAEASQAQQVVALPAGTYRVTGQVNNATATEAVKLIVSGATDSTVLTKTFSDAVVSDDDSEYDAINETFTLEAASQNVTFKINFVAVSGGANAAGAGRIRILLESA